VNPCVIVPLVAQLHGYFPTTSSFVCVFDDALIRVAREAGAEKKGLGFLKRYTGGRASDEETSAKIESSADLTSTEFEQALGQGVTDGPGRIEVAGIASVEIGPPSQSLEQCDFHLELTDGRKWWDHMEEEDRNRAANLLSPLLGDRLTNRWDQWEPPGHETGGSLDQRPPMVH
jgi:hypothetical protein